MGFDSEGPAQRDHVDLGLGNIHALETAFNRPRKAHSLGANLQDLILGVVTDHERDRNSVSGRRPQSLNSVQRRPFAQDRQHWPLGPGEFDADAAAQSPAEGPSAMAEIAGWVL